MTIKKKNKTLKSIPPRDGMFTYVQAAVIRFREAAPHIKIDDSEGFVDFTDALYELQNKMLQGFVLKEALRREVLAGIRQGDRVIAEQSAQQSRVNRKFICVG